MLSKVDALHLIAVGMALLSLAGIALPGAATCAAAAAASSDGTGTGTATTRSVQQPQHQHPTTRPGADNTGPSDPSALKVVTGLLKITEQGAVVENVEVRGGGVVIDADDVTFRNFLVVTQGSYGIVVKSGHRGIVIEDGEVTSAKSAALKGGGYVARRLNLHHLGADAIKPGSDVVVEACWIHHLGMSAGSHADGVQIRGKVSNAVFRGNHFDMPHGLVGFRPNSAFIIDTKDGPVTGVLIEGNWINGGGWSVHIVNSVTGAAVRNNLFGRECHFGVKRVGEQTLWENNRWWDTGGALN